MNSKYVIISISITIISLLLCVGYQQYLYALDSDNEILKSWKEDDKNNDRSVTMDEYSGVPALFETIDINSDKSISEIEIRIFVLKQSRQKIERRYNGEIHSKRPLSLDENIKFHENVRFADLGYRSLMMDIFHLKNPPETPMPVIVWVHGGGWKGGSRIQGVQRLMDLVKMGYCGVQIDYRLSDEEKWPAQIYDCKAAIRFLRAHASEYNLDPDRIGVWGSSAGGHLATLLGTSGDVVELEGIDGNMEYSSRVNAVCSWAGPTDFSSMLDSGLIVRKVMDSNNALTQLFGHSPLKYPEKLKEASPVTYATSDDPPMLMMHGQFDTTVPPSQGKYLDDALRQVGVDSEYILCKGERHVLNQKKHAGTVIDFFNRVFEFEQSSD